MKHLCRRLESQSLTGPVIQPNLDHLDVLVGNGFHQALLGHIFPKQSIEVHVGPTLPTRKRPDKVACAVQRVINLGVPAELLAVVVSQGFDPDLKGFEHPDDCGPNQVGCLV